MSLEYKKIWIDIEEPKTGIMFNSLINKFQQEKSDILITARDYDSTFQILDDHHIPYIKVGEHGGERLEDKLKSYIDRLEELFPHIVKFKPDFFITFSSVEGARIAYGLGIPSIGFNDEPRNIPVCKLLFPFLDKIITPKCVPKDWYVNLHADPKKLIRYNGIDEIGWLSEYVPDPNILDKFKIEKGQFVIIRSEPSFASYFVDKLKAEETLISEFFPQIFNEYPNFKFFIIVRTLKQENFLKKKLRGILTNTNIHLVRYLPNMVDLCFYASLVISGGGTIVRESSLLNVPSIEFFPGDTAPQEKFLMDNGFPLEHLRDTDAIVEKSIEILSQSPLKTRFDLSFKEKIANFENPNELCFKLVKQQLS